MIVKVKEIPVRHGGHRYLANEELNLSQADYEKIKKFVDVIDATSELADSSKSVEKMTVAELKAFAEEKGINLGDATKKDDILPIIQAALNA